MGRIVDNTCDCAVFRSMSNGAKIAAKTAAKTASCWLYEGSPECGSAGVHLAIVRLTFRLKSKKPGPRANHIISTKICTLQDKVRCIHDAISNAW